MGEVIAKAIGDPVARMWHDSCVYCCDDLDCSSGCGACSCHCQTHAADLHENDIEIHEDIINEHG